MLPVIENDNISRHFFQIDDNDKGLRADWSVHFGNTRE